MTFARHALLASALASASLLTGFAGVSSDTAEAATVCRSERVCRDSFRWVVRTGPRVCETVTYNGFVVDRDCVRTGNAWRVRVPHRVCRTERVCRVF